MASSISPYDPHDEHAPRQALATSCSSYGSVAAYTVAAIASAYGIPSVQVELSTAGEYDTGTRGRFTGQRSCPKAKQFKAPTERPEPIPLAKRKRMLARKLAKN